MNVPTEHDTHSKLSARRPGVRAEPDVHGSGRFRLAGRGTTRLCHAMCNCFWIGGAELPRGNVEFLEQKVL